MKAFDTAIITTGRAHEIRAQGYGAVIKYLRPDRTTLEEVQGLHSVGLKVVSVWERGQPNHAAYFNADQGKADGEAATQFAYSIGQPSQTTIFFAVDYDADRGDLDAIRDYLAAAREVCDGYGYTASIYGSGLVCTEMESLGLAHFGWLAQSTGWAEYPTAESTLSTYAIVQGPSTTILGWDCDADTINNPDVCW